MRTHHVRPAKRVEGTLLVPGDKSISHRALMLASVGVGSCRLSNISSAADVGASETAMRLLGVVMSNDQSLVEEEGEAHRDSESQILVEGRGWTGLKETDAVLDCANSGTTARTIMGLLAGRPFMSSIDGDHSLRARPMDRVVDPLSRMGARFDRDTLPLKLHGGRLRGIEYDLPIASAQVKTAVILAGLQAEGETVIIEPAPSRDHTERMLAYLGIPIDKQINRLIVKPTEIQNASVIEVPGDISSAAFVLVAAALLPGSEVRVPHVGVNPGRIGILEVLQRFGAQVGLDDQKEVSGEPRATVSVRAGDRRSLEITAAEVPAILDELPLVALLGACAGGETIVSGARELRVKESDRIAAIVDGLREMGADIEALPDGFIVRGGRTLTGATVDSRGDHRIAMTLAVAGLVATGSTAVQGWEAVPVSYPGFAADLEGVCVR
jgi:3-phosphoshikimate 1-carboxyvinyltransferase